MSTTLHQEFKKDVGYYRSLGYTKGQIAEILTDKYDFIVLADTVQKCITRNRFKRGTLKAKNIK